MAQNHKAGATARTRVIVAAAAGLAAAFTAAATGHGHVAPLVGWDAAAAVYMIWVWSSIGRMDAGQTAAHALREDPTRAMTEVILLIASVASLSAVGLVLIKASALAGAAKAVLAGLGVASVVLSWALTHTIFTLRYAMLYYGNTPGGVDFNGGTKPRYSDFAYLAFTVGMTFQVSDTQLESKEFRSSVLRQALLSYLFGTVIVATTINLIAGLTK